jgi:hypothetical protein
MAVTTKKGQPITASRNPQRPVAPVLTDAADTSRDAERIISRPENQLSNPYGVVRVPAPTNPAYRSTGDPRERVNNGKPIGCANTQATEDEMLSVGYTLAEIRKARGDRERENISGHRPRQVGKPGSRNSDTSARENSRMRSGQ